LKAGDEKMWHCKVNPHDTGGNELRKVMLLAALLAMVLAAAAPAFAQATATTDDSGENQYEQGQQNDQNTVVQDSICVNVQQAASNQYNAGDQAAAAESGDVIGDTNTAASAANIANALGITTGQVNACLNEVNAPGTASPVATASPLPTATATAPAGGGGGGGGTATAAAGSASAAAGGELPSTGGSSLLALGAGALLVAGGLLARRIVR
jgi:LPXTG-motif cell wall-anchored protein